MKDKCSIVYEWRGCYPGKDDWRTLVKLLADRDIQAWHCFWDEPWADWTVRLLCIETQADLPSLGVSGGWEQIDVSVLEQDGYGPIWGDVLGLFTYASNIALTLALYDDQLPSLANSRKLIHCLMNIWGYSRTDEVEAYGEWSALARILAAMEDEKDIDLLNKVAATILRKLHSPRGKLLF